MNNKIIDILIRYKFIFIMFVIILIPVLIPVLIPIKSIKFSNWFNVYGDYASNIIGIFIALITVLYQLDKGTVKLNREHRIDLYKKVIVDLNEIRNISKDSKKNLLDLYIISDIDKCIERKKMVFGNNPYILEDDDKLRQSYIEKRLKLIKKINEQEIKLETKLNDFLYNKILFNPINQSEKDDLKIELMRGELNKLEKHTKIIWQNISDFESNKYKLEKAFEKGKIEDSLIYIDNKNQEKHKLNKSLNLINLFLNYGKLYLECDLIYTDVEWKEDWSKEYNSKLNNILNREQLIKDEFNK